MQKIPAEPTPDLVADFWRAMQAHYGTTIIDKSNALEMRLAARFLQRANILDAPTFLKRFTTIIGRRIYAPFTPGIATKRHSLWSQLVVCVHEHQHVEQHDRDGKLRFSARYIASKPARTAYEAQAYICNIELHHWHTGQIPNIPELAKRLTDYGLRPSDIATAEQTLNNAAHQIQAGKLVTPASKTAIQWLQQNAPELAKKTTTFP